MPKYKWIDIDDDLQVVFERTCSCPGVAEHRTSEFVVEVDDGNRLQTPVCRKCGQDYRFSILKMKVGS